MSGTTGAQDLTTVRCTSFGTEFSWLSSSQGWICETCGTVTADYDKHGRWHAQLSDGFNDIHERLKSGGPMEAPPADSSWLEMEPSGRRRGRRVR